MRALGWAAGPVRRVLAVAAHADDLEIGCGGTLLQVAAAAPGVEMDVFLATGDARRVAEARAAAAVFLPGCPVRWHLSGLPDGRLPAVWNQVKDDLERVASVVAPDLILAPRRQDAHQDHRTLAELIPTVWRDHLILGYEIPKWDGDLGRPQLYVPLSAEVLQEKISRLQEVFGSQRGHDWFDPEVFRGLARVRGMECRAPYAEAFTVTKAVLTW